MTPASPVPVYPASIPALFTLLLEREKDRLLGPVVNQAIVNDKTPDRQVEQAVVAALAQLDEALEWAKGKM